MAPLRKLQKPLSCLFIKIFVILVSARDTFQQNPLQCGVPKISRAELIVHGYNTAPGDWPWHTAIYHRKSRSNNYACGGTLISEQFVLTAAHCVLNPDNGHQLVTNRIFVRLGVHNLDYLNSNSFQQHEIQQIHKPINITENELKNDIAILMLETMARLNDYVQPACLSSRKDLTGLFGTVIGWGVTEDDETSPILKSARIPVVDSITCLRSDRVLFGQILDEGIFCAGYTNGTSVCNGDSGGGLFFKVDDAWYLGGIVSFSKQRDGGSNLCHAKSYGAFTKVYAYLHWITSVTKMSSDLSLDNDNDETNQLLPRNCGVRNANHNIQGNAMDMLEFPWLAAIMRFKRVLRCSGSLINIRYVLTEADCVRKQFGLPTYGVLLGGFNEDNYPACNEGIDADCIGLTEEYGIESIEAHPHFSIGYYTNNIGLVRLNRDVTMKEYIRPICLPVAHELQTQLFDSYTLVSFKNKSPTESTSIIKVEADYVNNLNCQQKFYSLRPSNKLFCAKNSDISCDGLEGSFLGNDINYNGVRFVQFGILSKKESFCTNSATSVYTRVSSYMEWILDTIRP